MSDNLRKMIPISDTQESKSLKEKRFKKAINLRIKINNGVSGNNGPTTPVPVTPNRQNDSFSALEELLQCGICLERLTHPRMLPCQHTFCLGCLKTHVTARNLKFGTIDSPTNNDTSSNIKNPKFTVDSQIKSMSCPVCQKHMPLRDGIDSLDKLPRNLYLQSLLRVVEETPISPKVVENYRCVNCQMASAHQEQVCQHCMQIFCNVCWNEHLALLESNLSLLVKQLTECEDRVKHKLENVFFRCDTLEEKIKKATMAKVESILREEKHVLSEVTSIKKEGGITSDILLHSVAKLREEIIGKSKVSNNNHKVTTYLNLHRETSKILEQVNFFGEARLTFDPDTFKMEQISEGIYNDDDNQQQHTQTQMVSNSPENLDSMAAHYKARSFSPKLVWNKCPRPSGLGIPPWDENKLYIAATDSHYVLILDRSKFKLIERLTHPDMSCPTGITFSKSRKEMFVSDKWNHCIHAFSSAGEYLRNFSNLKLRSPDGIAIGPNEELIVCDTGNDRVLLVNPESGEKLGVIGVHSGVTQLNFPASVAVHGNDIIVADSGNNRVKIFNINGDLLQEIGSLGKNPGQFRSVEVVAVDRFGFILVGDAGNARIQVFKPDGTIVKILGSKSGFGWISGILVTQKFEIITADIKTRSLKIF
ncbi:unnamed protein product [Ceutorhynchus assimilis]|uniref:RING-type domain-containing protein n=1 Tax=Ceutorhynchus assimilis TaxID=467358 RepID=A0A9N9QBY4_9CUCU|nr:unnamed protein product [Ceutorhynchus assimilis]